MNLRNQIVRGGIWLGLLKAISFVISFLGGIVLARLLEPEDFGAVAMATGVFLVISRLFNIGIGTELIRLDERESHFHSWLWTFFWLNGALVAVSLGIALIVVYGTHSLSSLGQSVFGVVALGWVITNLLSPGRVLLQKHRRFRALAVLEFVPVLVGVPAAVLMAFWGSGTWSLVIPQAVLMVVTSVWAMQLEHLVPRWEISREAVQYIKRRMYWYMGFGLSEEGYQRGDDLILGGLLGDAVLGLYRRAYNLGGLLHQQIGVVLNQLSYSVHADAAVAEETRLKMLEFSTKIIVYGLLGITVVLAKYIETIVLFLYGLKWIASAEYFLWLLPFAVLWPLYHQYKGYVIARGQIQTATKVDLFKLGIMVSGAYIGIHLGGVPGVALAVDGSIFVGVLCLGVVIYRGRVQALVRLRRPFIFVILLLLGLWLPGVWFVSYVSGLYLLFLPQERTSLREIKSAIGTNRSDDSN